MAKSNVQRIGFFAAVDNIQHGHAVFSRGVFVMINRLKNTKPDKNQAKNGKNRVAPNGESRVMENTITIQKIPNTTAAMLPTNPCSEGPRPGLMLFMPTPPNEWI
nr:hypothetical protein [Anoxybacillus sp. PDR2]